MLGYGTAALTGSYSGSDNLARVRDLAAERGTAWSGRAGVVVTTSSTGREFVLFVPPAAPALSPTEIDSLVAACTIEGAAFAGVAWFDAAVLPQGAPITVEVHTGRPGPATVPVSVGPLIVDAARFAAVGGFARDFDPLFQDADLCLRLHRAGFDFGIHASAGVVVPDGLDLGEAPPRFRRLWWSYLAALRAPTEAPRGSA